jgi:hypothetical protein
MKGTALIVQMIHLAALLHDPSNKKHLLPTDFAPDSLTILVVLKLQILKDTASLPIIKYFVGLLEMFVMQTVL